MDGSTPLHLIYTETEVMLSRRTYGHWREIQDEYADYKASLGPWAPDEVTEYLADEYPDLSPSAPEQVAAFLASPRETHVLTFSRLALSSPGMSTEPPRLAALLAETVSLESFAEALDRLGPAPVLATLRRRGQQTVWALLAEPPEQPLLTSSGVSGASGWEASLSAALHEASGVYLTRASLPEGLDGFVCLLIERSLDATAPLRAMTEWLLGEYRHLRIDARPLAGLPPLEAWREVHALVFRGVLEDVQARVTRQPGGMDPAVVAHRRELDGQAALHRLSRRCDALCEMLGEAWEDPAWSAPRFHGD